MEKKRGIRVSKSLALQLGFLVKSHLQNEEQRREEGLDLLMQIRERIWDESEGRGRTSTCSTAVRRRVSEWVLGRRSGEDIYPKNGVKSGR